MKKKRLLASLGLTVGLLSGGIAAYFLAPQKGKDTQKIITKKINYVTQKSLKKLQAELLKLEIALETKK